MVIALCLLLQGLLWTGCDTSASLRKPPKVAVRLSRDRNVKVVIAMRLAASAADQEGAYGYVPGHALDRLNHLGEEDGNTFIFASGEAPDLTLRFNIRREGDRYTGSVDLNAPGWG